MFGSWRPSLIPALGLALLLPAATALAMDQPALLEMERLLRDLGFDPGAVDGKVDDETIAAIRRYQDFALLPGEPEPSEKLLNELRGVAAAFEALSAGKEKAPAPLAPEQRSEEPPRPEDTAAEKVLVPPPPPPPKLKPLEAVDERASPVAELPPAKQGATAAEETQPADSPASETEPLDPAAEAQARIDAELAPHRKTLEDGSVSRAELAQRFNLEGRQLLEAADYDQAILKFSVAIFLDPNFAGAYSNRGTAYQRQEEKDLAMQDFDKARELGFGGVRPRTQQMPLR